MSPQTEITKRSSPFLPLLSDATRTCPKTSRASFYLPPPTSNRNLTWTHFPLFLPPGQFLLEQARLREAAEMAERAAELESREFDVVFSAAHMLRWAKPRPKTEALPKSRPLWSRKRRTHRIQWSKACKNGHEILFGETTQGKYVKTGRL